MNEEKHSEELLDQEETIVDEPWAHQFEKEEEPSTRSARFHADPEASLYTKIMFGVVAVLVLVIAVWAVMFAMNMFKPNNQASQPADKVARLKVQSTTPTSSSETTTTSDTSSTKDSSIKSTPEQTTGGSTYTIKQGDSFYKIATAHGISLEALLAANKMTVNTLLLPGKTLVIPSVNSNANTNANTRTNANNSGGTHIVKAGETLSSISRAYGVPVTALRAANGLTSDALSVGQKLIIP